MDRQPERAREALTAIHEVSRQALGELRTVLGVLAHPQAAARPDGAQTAEGEQAFACEAAATPVAGAAP